MMNTRKVVNNIMGKRLTRDKRSKALEGMGVTNTEYLLMREQIPGASPEDVIDAIKRNKKLYTPYDMEGKV